MQSQRPHHELRARVRALFRDTGVWAHCLTPSLSFLVVVLCGEPSHSVSPAFMLRPGSYA